MKMKNPITALSDLFSKLVIEHGSAVIQEKHIALFKDELAILKDKFAILAAENQQLKTENQNLKTENTQLKKKIQIYEKPTHDNLLDENKIKLLIFLSKQQDRLTADDIAQALNINPQVVTFHLEELEKYHMVHGAWYTGAPSDWKLVQEGRRYLIENKLIS